MNKDLILNTFLQNNSLPMLLEAVGGELGCPVIVTDNAFHIVASFAPNGFEDSEYRRAISHSELPLSACTAITKALAESEAKRVMNGSGERTYLTAELKSAGAALGYIVYILFGSCEVRESDCLFAESLVAKQFFTDRRTGLAFDTAEEILIDLLDGKFKTEGLFLARASGTFLSQFSPQRYALIELVQADTAKSEHIGRSLEQSFHASHPLFYRGKMLLFLHEDHDISLLRSLIGEYELKAVLSEKLQSLFSLKKSYALSEAALCYLSEKESKPFLADCADYSLLMLLLDAEKRFDLSNEKVKALCEYDKRKGTELCLTLYTYLTCRHSLLKTSEKLFTHRNTVQYRIRKIKDDFSIDADESEGVFSLLISLSLALLRLGHEEVFILREGQ